MAIFTDYAVAYQSSQLLWMVVSCHDGHIGDYLRAVTAIEP